MEISSIENRIQVLSLETPQQASPTVFGNSEYWYSFLEKGDGDKEKLQQERLKYALDQLNREMFDTTFSRDCLFCRKHFTGCRTLLLKHLAEQHNFFFGSPDNIIFINEFLDQLEKMLKDLQCFYCEKVFKDWNTLKEHMRKKQHKRINPQNKIFDRFYIINYLELYKTWEDVQEEEDDCSLEESENETMEWTDEGLVFVCLFCDNKFKDFDLTLCHMKENHGFDFKYLKEVNRLNFYQQIKVINYIRRKVHDRECIICDRKFCFQGELVEHLIETGHTSSLPDSSQWDQPSYYFSTFENDSLLCALDVDDIETVECVVFPEDTVVPTTPSFKDFNSDNYH